METIRDLFDLSHTRAGAYLAGFTYPWEALAGISDLIRQLGPALGEEFEQRAPEVWVHRTATVAPTAYLGAPCILADDHPHRRLVPGAALQLTVIPAQKASHLIGVVRRQIHIGLPAEAVGSEISSHCFAPPYSPRWAVMSPPRL